MALISERDRTSLRERLVDLPHPVRLLVFTQAEDCHYCEQTKQITQELAELSSQITVEVVDRDTDPETAERYGIDKAPAIVVVPGDAQAPDTGIRFFGIPSGYEFTSLIEGVITVSHGDAGLGKETLAFLEQLDRPLHLQVFVTPTCPYCPRAVVLAHKLALASPWVQADMVEALEFPELANRYNVFGVPRTVINETIAVEGAVPEPYLLEKLQEAAAKAA